MNISFESIYMSDYSWKSVNHKKVFKMGHLAMKLHIATNWRPLISPSFKNTKGPL